jgi:DNA-binding Lrp family transcriptional regulator
MGAKRTLDQIDLDIVVKLAAGRRVAEIATELNISRQAVYKRLDKPGMEKLVESEQMRSLQFSLKEMQAQIGASLKVLVDIRDDDTLDPRVRAQSARTILEMASTKELTAPQASSEEGTEYGRAIIGPDGVPRVKVGGRVKELPAPIEAEYVEVKS